jgi:2'-5' RNA ligase
MHNPNKGFVEIRFSREIKEQFTKIVNDLIPAELLYNSPFVSHIKGNMGKTLHCTLFFGLDTRLLNDPELLEILSEFNVEQLELGDLFFLNGYQNLYRILCIEVLDKDNKLQNISDKIQNFARTNGKRYEFRPHLTLAYVTNDFHLPGELPEFPKTIAVAEVKASSELE